MTKVVEELHKSADSRITSAAPDFVAGAMFQKSHVLTGLSYQLAPSYDIEVLQGVDGGGFLPTFGIARSGPGPCTALGSSQV